MRAAPVPGRERAGASTTPAPTSAPPPDPVSRPVPGHVPGALRGLGDSLKVSGPAPASSPGEAHWQEDAWPHRGDSSNAAE